jgi:hypothetical protein
MPTPELDIDPPFILMEPELRARLRRAVEKASKRIDNTQWSDCYPTQGEIEDFIYEELSKEGFPV